MQSKPTEIDILRTTKRLLAEYGEGASFVAARQADALLANGDIAGRRAWMAIHRALEDMARTTRGRDDRLH
jgi:hypothetical protein